MNDKENILKEAEALTHKSVTHLDEPYGVVTNIPQPLKLKRKYSKHNHRLPAIDEEIKEIKQMIDNTYDIDKQISLSKCLVMLYSLKKEILILK